MAPPKGWGHSTHEEPSCDVYREELPSANNLCELNTKITSFIWSQLDYESAAPFKRDAHDNSAPLLRDLERTVARPWLHGGHGVPLFIRTPDAGRADVFSAIIPLIAP
jgi:hypothetical protein